MERITFWLQSSKVARYLLTVLRVWIGWLWISSGIEKMGTPEWVGGHKGSALLGFANHALSMTHATPQNPHPNVQQWYASFLQHIVIQHTSLFSYLVILGEIAAGLCLILGLFTTLGTVIGALLNLNYLLGGSVSTNPGMLIAEFVLLLGSFNASMYGIDYWILPFFKRIRWSKPINVPLSSNCVKPQS